MATLKELVEKKQALMLLRRAIDLSAHEANAFDPDVLFGEGMFRDTPTGKVYRWIRQEILKEMLHVDFEVRMVEIRQEEAKQVELREKHRRLANYHLAQVYPSQNDTDEDEC